MVTLGCAMLLPRPGLSGDWPQLLGPARNGVSEEKGLLLDWPKKGLPVLWQQDVGEGFSAPSVAGETVLLFQRTEGRELIEARNVADGKVRWHFDYLCKYRDKLGSGDGPRATPIVDGGNVYLLGVTGMLHCLELKSGTKVWSRNLDEDYELLPSFFGVGTTPIIENKLIVINIGGSKAGIVALDKETGKEKWTATDHAASYSSPVAATVDGARHLVFLTREGLVSLDPENGKVRLSMHWRSKMDASVNAANPVIVGNQVFLSACYDTGAGVFTLSKDKADAVWKSDNAISAHYITSVVHDGYLYGFHGRHDFHETQLRCVDWKTGKVLWSEKSLTGGPMIFADGHLIVLTEKGELVLVEPSPDKYIEKARFQALEAPCRAQLALSNGRLFARDNKKIVCWDIHK